MSGWSAPISCGVPGSEISILRERAGFLLRAKLLARAFDRRGDGGANFVEQLADDRLFLFGERFHLLAPGRNAAAAPRYFTRAASSACSSAGGFDLAQRVVAQLFQRMSHETLKR